LLLILVTHQFSHFSILVFPDLFAALLHYASHAVFYLQFEFKTHYIYLSSGNVSTKKTGEGIVKHQGG